jgi:hypothetical protein
MKVGSTVIVIETNNKVYTVQVIEIMANGFRGTYYPYDDRGHDYQATGLWPWGVMKNLLVL